MPGASIKSEALYEDLRKQGDSKQKAAKNSNAAAARGTSAVARKGRDRILRRLEDGAAIAQARQGNRIVGRFGTDEVETDLQIPELVIRVRCPSAAGAGDRGVSG
jgi:hypothetical protein